LIELGDLKYTYTPYTKENRRTYTKKEEKIMNMDDTPTSPPNLIRSTTTKEKRYTFSIQPRFIMRDVKKRGLLNPLKKITQDDSIPMGNIDAYYIYHQRKVHATNFCKALEVAILDLISQGRYEID